MKNLFLSMIAVVAISASAAASTSDSKTVIKETAGYTTEAVSDLAFGTCTITVTWTDEQGIKHSKTWKLPANTAGDCEQMLDNTIKALDKGWRPTP